MWPSSIPFDEYTMVCLSILSFDGQLGCLALRNNVAVNIRVHVFVWMRIHFMFLFSPQCLSRDAGGNMSIQFLGTVVSGKELLFCIFS